MEHILEIAEENEVVTTKENYQIKFNQKTIPVKAKNLQDVAELCMNYGLVPKTDPKSILLPSGQELAWNPYMFNAWYGKGRITEEELIEMQQIN